MGKDSLLLQPIQVGNLTLKNRVMFPPLTTGYEERDGSIGPRSLAFYERLAKGGVLYEERAFIGGEYSGAKSNPEIVTPQNIMEETFDWVLSRYQDNNSGNNDGIKQLVVQFGSHKVAVEMESLIRQAHRRNGTASIVI